MKQSNNSNLEIVSIAEEILFCFRPLVEDFLQHGG